MGTGVSLVPSLPSVLMYSYPSLSEGGCCGCQDGSTRVLTWQSLFWQFCVLVAAFHCNTCYDFVCLLVEYVCAICLSRAVVFCCLWMELCNYVLVSVHLCVRCFCNSIA